MRWNLFEAMNSDGRMHDKLEERLEAKKKTKTKTVISDASGKRAVFITYPQVSALQAKTLRGNVYSYQCRRPCFGPREPGESKS